MDTIQAAKITLEAAHPSMVLMFVGLAVLGIGIVLCMILEGAEFLGILIAVCGLVMTLTALYSNDASIYRINERQTAALEQQLGYADVSVDGGKFIASDHGKYVRGRLYKVDDLTYYVIIEQ